MLIHKIDFHFAQNFRASNPIEPTPNEAWAAAEIWVKSNRNDLIKILDKKYNDLLLKLKSKNYKKQLGQL